MMSATSLTFSHWPSQLTSINISKKAENKAQEEFKAPKRPCFGLVLVPQILKAYTLFYFISSKYSSLQVRVCAAEVSSLVS